MPFTTSLHTTNNGATPKIGFVVPRYGLEVVGGAERLVRGMAEELHARSHAVAVLTTCTSDMVAWNNHYPPGPSVINGVPVLRFPIDTFDIRQVHRVGGKALAGQRVPYEDQVEFIRNTINSQALYAHLREREQEYACVIFAPYMFGTTYWGVATVPDKALLLPCLHDEPYAYFTVYHELLEQVRGIIFNAEAERRFAIERLGVVNQSSAVVGYGFDPATPQGDGVAFRTRRNLPPELLFYTGRLQPGKNVPLLIEYFVRYKSERPGPLTLALAGEGEVISLARPDLVVLGFLDEHDLRDAYAAAALLCQPSLNESFSIVIMEAWLQLTPVLVHADCAVTSQHVAQSGGGWCFGSYEQFRSVLDQMLAAPDERARRGAAGRAYVQSQYGWEQVIERLLEAIERFGTPVTRHEQLSRRGVRRALAFSRERFEEHLARVLVRAEADLAQGLSHQQVQELHGAAQVARPDYQVRSTAPIIGGLIGWLRRQLTAHLREPYLDPFIARQEAYNQRLLDTLLPVLERSLRSQRGLESQVLRLEQRIEELRVKKGEFEGAAPQE